jgi:L-asparaginase/Glu-tRNA(Gln) amidotransferase subunit D
MSAFYGIRIWLDFLGSVAQSRRLTKYKEIWFDEFQSLNIGALLSICHRLSHIFQETENFRSPTSKKF